MVVCNRSSVVSDDTNTSCDISDNGTGSSKMQALELRLSDEGYLAAGIFLMSLGVIAFIGNNLVIYVFFKEKLYRRPVNLFVLNMAMSDLIVSFIGHPFSAVSAFRHEWFFGLSGCYVYGFICYTCACNSIMTHAAVSYFRYAVVCKYRYVGRVSMSVVLKVLVAIWIYSLFWTATPLIGWSSYAPEPYNVTCSIEWYNDSAADISYVWGCFIFVLVVPLSIMIYSYLGVYRQNQRLTELSVNVPLPANISSRYILDLEKDVIRISATMTIVFMITWTPYTIISLAFASGIRFYNSAVLLPTFFAKSSCAYNPIIYCYTHKKFRESLIHAFCSTKNSVGVASLDDELSEKPGPSAVTFTTRSATREDLFKVKVAENKV